jgi:hypothetical protein
MWEDWINEEAVVSVELVDDARYVGVVKAVDQGVFLAIGGTKRVLFFPWTSISFVSVRPTDAV